MAGGDDSAGPDDNGSALSDDAYLVNQQEAAELLGISSATFTKWLKAHESIPVVRRGSHGVAYQFDARDLAQWKREHEAEVERERQARAGELRQMRFDMFGVAEHDPSRPGLSAEELIKEIQAQRDSDRLARDRGELVRSADVREQIEAAFLGLRTDVMALADRVAREFALEREQRERVRGLCREALFRMARRLDAGGGEASAEAAE